MKRVTALFTDELHKELKVYAATNGLTLIDVIRDAVKLYLHNADNCSIRTNPSPHHER